MNFYIQYPFDFLLEGIFFSEGIQMILFFRLKIAIANVMEDSL